jgi:hypothetical protein
VYYPLVESSLQKGERALSEMTPINRLNAISSEIQHEDDLIGQRTTWLVMSQSFLFGAFATLIGQMNNLEAAAHRVKLLQVLIPLVGLLLPILVLLAVGAATYEIWQLRTEHDRVCEMLDAKGDRLEKPRRRPTWVMMLGQLLPIAAGLGFVLAWIMILAQIRG